MALLAAALSDPSCAPLLLASASSRLPTEQAPVARAALMLGTVPDADRRAWFALGGLPAGWAVTGACDPDWLASTAPGAGTVVRRALARNPLTPGPIVGPLVWDADLSVAAIAATHPGADPDHVRARLGIDPDLGVFALEADRAAWSAAVMVAHPGLVGYFAGHANSTFRRLAARQPGLTSADARSLFGPRGSFTGARMVFTRNPLSVPVERLRWFDPSDPHRALAASVLSADGTLLPGTSALSAAAIGSPTVDRALATAVRSRGLAPLEAGGILNAFAARPTGVSAEPDVCADVARSAGVTWAVDAARRLSSSRMKGAARTSVWMDAAAPVLLEAVSFFSYVGAPQSSASRADMLDEAVRTGSALPGLLGEDVAAWRVFSQAAGSWPGTVADLAFFATDTVRITAPRLVQVPRHPASSAAARRA